VTVSIGQAESRVAKVKRDLTRYPEVVQTSKTIDANRWSSSSGRSSSCSEAELPSLLTELTPNHPGLVAHRGRSPMPSSASPPRWIGS
jgi:hypothetical protein